MIVHDQNRWLRAEFLYTMPRVSCQATAKADRSCRLSRKGPTAPRNTTHKNTAARIRFGHTQRKLPDEVRNLPRHRRRTLTSALFVSYYTFPFSSRKISKNFSLFGKIISSGIFPVFPLTSRAEGRIPASVSWNQPFRFLLLPLSCGAVSGWLFSKGILSLLPPFGACAGGWAIAAPGPIIN